MSYDMLIGIFVFLFGIVFGSFYNVVIYRIPANMNIAKGRSMCFSCKHSLSFFDLFPLLSYIFLGGKCRYCKAKISFRYFFVELLTGLLFLLSYFHFKLTPHFFIICIFFSMLVIVGFIDYDTMYIYDIILIIFASILFVFLFVENGINIKNNIFGALAGFILYYTIYFVAKMIYKQEAFGFGDALLNAVIGLVISIPNIILASFLSFFVALFFIIVVFVLGKKFSIKQEIPFGPYMCISAIIVSLYGDEIINFYIQSFL